jgi:hypothetical protein
MLTLFGDIEGAILINFTPKGETINRIIVKEALRGRRLSSDEEVMARCKIG